MPDAPSQPLEPVYLGNRRRPRFGEGAKPHELYDPPLPAPKYGETRAAYSARTGLVVPDDGRIFRAWCKNRSLNYREQWLNPESWERFDARRRKSQREYEQRNRGPRNTERTARRDGTLEEKRESQPEELHRLSIARHGITAEQYEAYSPELKEMLRQLDLAGVKK